MGLFGKKKSKEPDIEEMLTQADVERLAAGLGRPDVRVAASNALRANNSDPRVVVALIAALKDDDYDVRASVIMILATSSDQRVVEPLIAALKDESEGVRLGAAMAVGTVVAKTPGGDPRALAALKSALDAEQAPALKDVFKIVVAIAEELSSSIPGADPLQHGRELARAYAALQSGPVLGEDPVARDAMLKIWEAISAGEAGSTPT
jgi:HEAT repeat protein